MKVEQAKGCLMSRKIQVAGFAAVAAIVLAGCEAVETDRMPTAGQGLALYQANCAVCHGDTGIGDGPMARAMTQAPANRVDSASQYMAGMSMNSLDNLESRPPKDDSLDGKPDIELNTDLLKGTDSLMQFTSSKMNNEDIFKQAKEELEDSEPKGPEEGDLL